MRYIIFNDLHYFSKYVIKENLHLTKSRGITNVFLGDNIDVSNCRKKDIDKAIDALKMIKPYFDVFVTGNHELKVEMRIYQPHKKILFTHGDFVLWGNRKAMEYRSKKPGTNPLKWHVFGPVLQWFRKNVKKYKLKKDQLERIVEACLHFKCHTIVMGHAHARQKIDMTYKNVRIIILPRGRNELDL